MTVLIAVILVVLLSSAASGLFHRWSYRRLVLARLHAPDPCQELCLPAAPARPTFHRRAQSSETRLERFTRRAAEAHVDARKAVAL